MYWNGIAVNRAELKSNFMVAAALADRPNVEVNAERQTSFDDFVSVFAAAKSAGLEVSAAGIE
ncbi:hypothetical protein ELE36_17115 [Pseudolysobacter antarcticus]|uniref:Uncharacterized protein n=1 Tax=Pseudolysobacter antarcticus TaxID=2511995 RepID=A0A411HN77_9GAMM|nr:hypothetical protein ELE36_17115 [Pseudolysobacter antarcticus]